jgi:hypothetical protein
MSWYSVGCKTNQTELHKQHGCHKAGAIIWNVRVKKVGEDTKTTGIHQEKVKRVNNYNAKGRPTKQKFVRELGRDKIKN